MSKPFNETGLGKFLSGKGFSTILDAVGTVLPGAKLLADVKDMVIKSPEYKALPEADQKEFNDLYYLQLRELDMILEDRKNARASNVAINVSEQSSWLSKNIAACLAIGWTLFTIFIFSLLLCGKINAKENLVFLIVNSVTNIVMLIVGFYFGSSVSSKGKDATISELLKKAA